MSKKKRHVQIGQVWKHCATSNMYLIEKFTSDSSSEKTMVIYKSLKDNRHWNRLLEEFLSPGRFEYYGEYTTDASRIEKELGISLEEQKILKLHAENKDLHERLQKSSKLSVDQYKLNLELRNQIQKLEHPLNSEKLVPEPIWGEIPTPKFDSSVLSPGEPEKVKDEEIQRWKVENTRLNTRLEHFKKAYREKHEHLKMLYGERNNLEESNKRLSDEVRKLREECKNKASVIHLEKTSKQVAMDNSIAFDAVLNAKITKLEKELQDVNCKLDNSKIMLHDERDKVLGFQKECRIKENLISIKDVKFQELEAKYKELESSANLTIAALNHTVDELKRENFEWIRNHDGYLEHTLIKDNKIAELEKELQKVTSEKVTAEKDCQSLQLKMSKLCEENGILKTQILRQESCSNKMNNEQTSTIGKQREQIHALQMKINSLENVKNSDLIKHLDNSIAKLQIEVERQEKEVERLKTEISLLQAYKFGKKLPKEIEFKIQSLEGTIDRLNSRIKGIQNFVGQSKEE